MYRAVCEVTGFRTGAEQVNDGNFIYAKLYGGGWDSKYYCDRIPR